MAVGPRDPGGILTPLDWGMRGMRSGTAIIIIFYFFGFMTIHEFPLSSRWTISRSIPPALRWEFPFYPAFVSIPIQYAGNKH
jgi:hypothetical protein